jgi:hypothetical protein
MQAEQHRSRNRWVANPKEEYVARVAQKAFDETKSMEAAYAAADKAMEELAAEEKAVVVQTLGERYLRAMANRLLANTNALNREQLLDMIRVGPIGGETPFEDWKKMTIGE